MRKLILFLFLLSSTPLFAYQANVYIGSADAGMADGSSCANQHIYTFFNTAGNWTAGATHIGPGTIVHICGTITVSSNTTALTFQGSGSAGNIITLIFETGAIVQAPYFPASVGGVNACGGGICGQGLSYITVEGNNTGIIQNTDNGSAAGGYGNQQGTELVDVHNTTHTTVQNLTIRNSYIRTSPLDVLNDNVFYKCIDISGSNNLIYHNTLSNNGWCIFDSFLNGDTTNEISTNTFSNNGHDIMVANSGASKSASNYFIHDNNFNGPGNTWDSKYQQAMNDGPYTITGGSTDKISFQVDGGGTQTATLTAGSRTAAQIITDIQAGITGVTGVVVGSHFVIRSNLGIGLEVPFVANGANTVLGLPVNYPGLCDYHEDGLHIFGDPSGSLDNLYLSNNYFHGNWGYCPTGFLFVEGPDSTPSNLKNTYVWNNVGIVQSTAPASTNGWFNQGMGLSGVQKWYANTIYCTSSAIEITYGFAIQNASALTFENNVVAGCGGVLLLTSNTFTLVDRNVYDIAHCGGGNCFDFNGAFESTFANWKTACSCDTNTITTTTPHLNSDASPQSNSPTLSVNNSNVGANLTSVATGNLATLINDTTLGATRSTNARPNSSWDVGPFQFTASDSLSFNTQPTNVNSGSTIASFVISVLLPGGGTDTGSSASITLVGDTCTVTAGSPVSATAGTATFGSVIVTGNQACHLTASASGITSATSNSFNVTDVTAPTPGNSGVLTTSNILATSVTLNWTKGTDNVSPSNTLTYTTYKSSSNNITSLANVLSNGTLVSGPTTDIASVVVNGLTCNTTNYFNVLITDQVSNQAAYNGVSAVTASCSAPVAGVGKGRLIFKD